MPFVTSKYINIVDKTQEVQWFWNTSPQIPGPGSGGHSPPILHSSRFAAQPHLCAHFTCLLPLKGRPYNEHVICDVASACLTRSRKPKIWQKTKAQWKHSKKKSQAGILGFFLFLHSVVDTHPISGMEDKMLHKIFCENLPRAGSCFDSPLWFAVHLLYSYDDADWKLNKYIFTTLRRSKSYKGTYCPKKRIHLWKTTHSQKYI